jgi:CheY-like chemotaxis protein
MFVVRLPLAADPDESRSVASSSGEAASAASLKILVVDDNHDGAEALLRLLELHGHEVRMVHDGEAAVAAACEYRPQVMLLDIGLPLIDGYEVCRPRQEINRGAGSCAVVALSGWGRPGGAAARRSGRIRRTPRQAGGRIGAPVHVGERGEGTPRKLDAPAACRAGDRSRGGVPTRRSRGAARARLARRLAGPSLVGLREMPETSW